MDPDHITLDDLEIGLETYIEAADQSHQQLLTDLKRYKERQANRDIQHSLYLKEYKKELLGRIDRLQEEVERICSSTVCN